MLGARAPNAGWPTPKENDEQNAVAYYPVFEISSAEDNYWNDESDDNIEKEPLYRTRATRKRIPRVFIPAGRGDWFLLLLLVMAKTNRWQTTQPPKAAKNRRVRDLRVELRRVIQVEGY